MSLVLYEAAKNLQVFRYTTVTTACVVLYEYAIKFDDEVRYLWGRKFTFAGSLLFLCRYFPIAAALQALYSFVLTTDLVKSRCMTGLVTNSCLIYFQFSISVLVIFTRAYAAWGATRRMLILLTAAYAGASAGTAYVLYVHVQSYLPLDLHIGRGCVFNIQKANMWHALLIHVGCDTLAAALLIIKSVEHVRFMKHARLNYGGQRGENLLRVMASDGIYYFLLNLAVNIANTVVMMRVEAGLRDFMLIVHGGLQNILCARLLFHLQTAHEASIRGSYSNYYLSENAVSGIQFASDFAADGRGRKRLSAWEGVKPTTVIEMGNSNRVWECTSSQHPTQAWVQTSTEEFCDTDNEEYLRSERDSFRSDGKDCKFSVEQH